MTLEKSENNNGKQPTEDDNFGADPPPPMPLDGGWGWMVVAASLVCNIIVDGVCFSFGIFYVEFLDYFGESKAKTAWVGSLVPGMYLGVGKSRVTTFFLQMLKRNIGICRSDRVSPRQQVRVSLGDNHRKCLRLVFVLHLDFLTEHQLVDSNVWHHGR